MKYEIITRRTKECGTYTRVHTFPRHEAFENYIALVASAMIPLFLEHHVLSTSFSLGGGHIDYPQKMDWEDLEYMNKTFEEFGDEYIYIYI